MRKINLKSYDIEVSDTETGRPKKIPYDVRASLANILFHPELRLGGMDLLKANELATKILSSPPSEDGEWVLLEEEEYQRLHNAITSVHGFSKNEVELVRRVLEAQPVEVTEKSS
jgi:hypothetical protein